MLSRKPYQARFDFDIRGITYAECFSDFLAKKSGDDSDDDSDSKYRLDRIEYASQQAQSESDNPEDEFLGTSEPGICDDSDRDVTTPSPLSEPFFELDTDLEVGERSDLRIRRLELLREAMETLTDQQATAVWLWARGLSEREAAEFMGISQPTYHGMLFGKKGIGGAMRKLSKYFQKHPITPLLLVERNGSLK
jgi:DNA-directed RNA polymerase specialized sigma24 family protein